MKILIIGASGFLGKICFDFFSQQHNTFGVDQVTHSNKDIIIDFDFSITKKLIVENNFDLIINCAGSSDILKSFRDPEKDFDLNTRLVGKILTELHHNSPSTKLINLSSAAVYGNPISLPVKETDATLPLSPYGKHKLEAENIIHSYFQEKAIRGLSVRIFSAYGVGLKRQFFYDLSKKLIENPDTVLLHGTGKESRDFIYATDILEAINCLIDKAEFKGEVYNLANGNEVIIEEAADAYAGIFGYKGKIIFNQEQLLGYPLNWKADISKIKALGFKPRISLSEGMTLYSGWIKRNLTP